MASYVQRLPHDVETVVLDIDSTDAKGHGHQQELFFNTYYDGHIFHPLVILDGESGQLVTAVLRPGNVGDGDQTCEYLEQLIGLIRLLRPGCAVCVRADSGFAAPRSTSVSSASRPSTARSTTSSALPETVSCSPSSKRPGSVCARPIRRGDSTGGSSSTSSIRPEAGRGAG